LTFAALRFRPAPQQQFEFSLASDEFGHAACVESLISRLCQRQKAWCATLTKRTKRGRLFMLDGARSCNSAFTGIGPVTVGATAEWNMACNWNKAFNTTSAKICSGQLNVQSNADRY
jgi:hypothetical protein